MPVSYSLTRRADSKPALICDVQQALGDHLFDIMVDVGIASTWHGSFDMAAFNRAVATLGDSTRATLAKYIFEEYTFDSWR
jgi:hypothetical protein